MKFKTKTFSGKRAGTASRTCCLTPGVCRLPSSCSLPALQVEIDDAAGAGAAYGTASAEATHASRLAGGRAPHWQKVALLSYLLRGYDSVLYVDADATVGLAPSRRIRSSLARVLLLCGPGQQSPLVFAAQVVHTRSHQWLLSLVAEQVTQVFPCFSTPKPLVLN